MSCYFRHIPELLKEAGLKVTPENKKAVDKAHPPPRPSGVQELP